jgi:hypothetical protein
MRFPERSETTGGIDTRYVGEAARSRTDSVRPDPKRFAETQVTRLLPLSSGFASLTSYLQ